MKELPKVYEPQQVESSIYEMWMENDCFKATPDPDKKPYSIVMPPPNVTGQLHMGHALDATLQDISATAKSTGNRKKFPSTKTRPASFLNTAATLMHFPSRNISASAVTPLLKRLCST